LPNHGLHVRCEHVHSNTAHHLKPVAVKSNKLHWVTYLSSVIHQPGFPYAVLKIISEVDVTLCVSYSF